MDAMTNIERFETEIKKIKREGADKLLKYCQTSDFYTAREPRWSVLLNPHS